MLTSNNTTLTLPPIEVLASAADQLATAAQTAGNTALMHAINKAAAQLHAGCAPVVTAGGFLIESRTRGGIVHRVSNLHGCSCEAGTRGRACWHQQLIAIIEQAQMRAVTIPQRNAGTREQAYRQALAAINELFA